MEWNQKQIRASVSVKCIDSEGSVVGASITSVVGALISSVPVEKYSIPQQEERSQSINGQEEQ